MVSAASGLPVKNKLGSTFRSRKAAFGGCGPIEPEPLNPMAECHNIRISMA
jgi:hypothetical protein